MRTLLTSFLLLFINLITYAQLNNKRIEGSVNDHNLKPLPSVTVTLLKDHDSSVVKSTLSDKTGKFSFENVSKGKYLVSFSAVGHSIAYSPLVELSEENMAISVKPVNLLPVSKTMATVVVNNKLPVIEQKAGKTVINVEASPTNVGLNVLDLLQKSPGVTVDNDGNISLKGKQGVMILIDGKPTYMSGADLAAYLKNMQSTSLSQIEIMTNPPAKYDASGNSGHYKYKN